MNKVKRNMLQMLAITPAVWMLPAIGARPTGERAGNDINAANTRVVCYYDGISDMFIYRIDSANRETGERAGNDIMTDREIKGDQKAELIEKLRVILAATTKELGWDMSKAYAPPKPPLLTYMGFVELE